MSKSFSNFLMNAAMFELGCDPAVSKLFRKDSRKTNRTK